MCINRPILLAFFLAAGCSLTWANTCTPPATVITTDSIGALPSSFNNTGCFLEDDSEEIFSFSISSPETVNMITTSYGSSLEGFWPVLTLYNGTTNAEIDANAGAGPCGTRIQSPVYGACKDDSLTDVLATGSYLLVLTQDNNTDAGNANFNATGAQYSRNGLSDFTGTDQGESPAMFVSELTGNQLTANWAVTITDVVPAVPEPVTGLLGFSGILVTWAVRRRRRRTL